MKNKKEVKTSYHSVLEFDRAFFPEVLEKRQGNPLQNAQSLGINTAKESVNKARKILAVSNN